MTTLHRPILAGLAALVAGCASTGPALDGAMTLTVSPKNGGGFTQQPTPKALQAGPPRIGAERFNGSLTTDDVQLGDATMADYYSYEAVAGEKIVVSMESEAVDPYVMVLGADDDGNLSTIAADDDGGLGLNARVAVECPEDGIYYVVANTAGAGQLGAYELGVRSEGQLEIAPSTDSGRYALLVGAGDYPNGLDNDLEAVAEDLIQMRSVLVDDLGFAPADILVLQDSRASRHNVVRGFREHLARAGADGVAVFYFSGHGVQVGANLDVGVGEDREADDTDDALFLADSSFLIDDELGYLLGELAAGNVLAILDACYSGTGTMLAGGAVPKEVRVEDLGGTARRVGDALAKAAAAAPAPAPASGRAPEPETHVLIAASREIEVSWCAGAYQYTDAPVSVFTFNLARALRELDGDTSLVELVRSAELGMLPWLDQTGLEQIPQVRGVRAGESFGAFLKAAER